jgi:hypothetical protein
VTFATWVAAASGVEVDSGVDVFVGKGVKVGSDVCVGGKGVELAAWLNPEKLPHAITMIDTSTRKYSKRFMKISSCFYVLHPQTAAQKYTVHSTTFQKQIQPANRHTFLRGFVT